MQAPQALAQAQHHALLRDAIAGLTAPRKTLPCKWLYDSTGARLFEAITRLPEYYPTRTETGILLAAAPAIAAAEGPGAAVVEFGPGDGRKVCCILPALAAPAAYVPVDIAADWVQAAASRVAAMLPGLRVLPVVADFTQPFRKPTGLGRAPCLGFFPGSTIGNFTPAQAMAFLRTVRDNLGAGAKLLLGADLVKPLSVLLPAYDDAAGVTAAFNLNLLRRLNREAGADFDLSGFRHQVRWNPEAEAVEMHLESLRPQQVRLGGMDIRFAMGETIHTESSHKYRPDALRALAAAAGWRVDAVWMDDQRLFSVWLLRG